jgi:hypothetical protein
MGKKMNFLDLVKLLKRADSFRKKLHIKDGLGAKWSYTFEDGETTSYSIEGVISPEEVENLVASALVWLWSLKDYVKKYVVNKGISKDWIEERVNTDPNLCICADLANFLKHGGRDERFKPRSPHGPELGKVKYQIPQEAMGAIIYGVCDVSLDVRNSS